MLIRLFAYCALFVCVYALFWCLHICLIACLIICLFACLFVCLFVCLLCWFLCVGRMFGLCVQSFICLCVDLFICLLDSCFWFIFALADFLSRFTGLIVWLAIWLLFIDFVPCCVWFMGVGLFVFGLFDCLFAYLFVRRCFGLFVIGVCVLGLACLCKCLFGYLLSCLLVYPVLAFSVLFVVGLFVSRLIF